MRYDESEELLGPQPIGQSPYKAADESSHDEHEVELPDMYQSVDEQRNGECHIGRTPHTDTALHEAPPKDLLGLRPCLDCLVLFVHIICISLQLAN